MSSASPQLPRFVRIVAIAGPPTAALVTLVCAGVGVVPALPALAAAAALTAAVGTTRLVRLALRIHARVHSFGPCRGAGYLGMGALATGLSVVLLPAAPPDARAVIATVGLAFGAVLYLIGLLLLPGAATTTHARLRRCFDGLSLGISIAFAVWLLPPQGPMPEEALAVGAVAARSGWPPPS